MYAGDSGGTDLDSAKGIAATLVAKSKSGAPSSLLRKRMDSILCTYPDPAFKRRAQIIISNLEADSARTILDAGCGFGIYEAILHALFSRLEVVATDIDASRLGRARSKLPMNFQFVCSDTGKHAVPECFL